MRWVEVHGEENEKKNNLQYKIMNKYDMIQIKIQSVTPCVRIALDKWQQSAVNDVYNSDTKNQGFPQSIDRSHLQYHLQYSKNDPNKRMWKTENDSDSSL